MALPLTTLCYIEHDGKYLMMHRIKEKHDINEGKWIGIGGHFEQDESPEECLLREVWEETGLRLTSYRFRGLVTFVADIAETEYMCLFTADTYEGELTDMDRCREGELAWIPKEEVPKLNLWEGDRYFFELLARDLPFFSVKMRYVGDSLQEVLLGGKPLQLERTARN